MPNVTNNGSCRTWQGQLCRSAIMQPDAVARAGELQAPGAEPGGHDSFSTPDLPGLDQRVAAR